MKREDVKNILSPFGDGFINAPACWRIWIIAFFCLLPVVFPALAEVTSVPGVVTGNHVNMRVSPALRSEVIGQLERGQEVRILLTDGEWCAIIPPTEMSAWISAQYIKDGLVTGSRVNVRSGPGISYGRLTYLRKGTVVTVLEEKEGWVKIKLPGTGRLWVSARFIDQSQIGTSSDKVPPQETGRAGRVVSFPGVQDDSSPGGRESTVITVFTSSPSSSTPPVRSITSPGTIPSVRSVPSVLAKSYSGYIENLAQPFSTADREYAYKLLKNRFDSRPLAFLNGDTIDLKKYSSRKVRLWAIMIEKKANQPALMEVKGVGFLW